MPNKICEHNSSHLSLNGNISIFMYTFVKYEYLITPPLFINTLCDSVCVSSENECCVETKQIEFL